jgi:heat shock protein HslJ
MVMKNSALLAAILVAFAGGLVMTGCSDDENIPGEVVSTWQLQVFALEDGTTVQVDDPSKYSLALGDNGEAAIVSDCNRCSGRYFVDGSTFSFGPVACTAAACGPDSLDFRFQAALGTASRYEIVDGRLVLEYEGGNMSFTEAAN